MSTQHVVDTITNRIQTDWPPASSGVVDVIQWEQIDDRAVGTLEPFVALEFPRAFHDQAQIKDDQSGEFVEVGSPFVHIFTPIGTDLRQARTWNEEIAALFRLKEISGITFRAPMPNSIRGNRGDGNWNQAVYCTLPYEYRTHHTAQ